MTNRFTGDNGFIGLDSDAVGDGTEDDTEPLDTHLDMMMANNEAFLWKDGYSSTWATRNQPVDRTEDDTSHYWASKQRGYIQTFWIPYRRSLKQIDFGAIVDAELYTANTSGLTFTIGATVHSKRDGLSVPVEGGNVLGTDSYTVSNEGERLVEWSVNLSTENILDPYENQPLAVRVWIESDRWENQDRTAFTVLRSQNSNWSVFDSETAVNPAQNMIYMNSNQSSGIGDLHAEPIQEDSLNDEDYAYINSRHSPQQDITSILGGDSTSTDDAYTQLITHADIKSIHAHVRFNDEDDQSYSSLLDGKKDKRQVQNLPEKIVRGENQTSHARNVNEIYERDRVLKWGIEFDDLANQTSANSPLNYNDGDSSQTHVKKWPLITGFDADGSHAYLQEWVGMDPPQISDGKIVGIFQFIPILVVSGTQGISSDPLQSSVTAEWNFKWEVDQHIPSGVSGSVGGATISTTSFDLKADKGDPFTHFPISTSSRFPFLFQQWVNRGGEVDPLPSYLENERPWRAGILYEDDLDLVQTVRASFDISDFEQRNDPNLPMTTPWRFRVGLEWDPAGFGGYVDSSPWDSAKEDGLSDFDANVVMVGQTIFEKGPSN